MDYPSKFTQIYPDLTKNSPYLTKIRPKFDQEKADSILNYRDAVFIQVCIAVIKWSEGCFKKWKIKGEVVILSTSSLYRISWNWFP